jgi:hypothetical protein
MATVNLGSIKFKWKGTYSGATAYTVDDVVEYNGSSYICILASTGNLPTNATYFEQMSSAGTNGTNGTDLTTTLTTQGDLVYRDGSGLQRLGAGTSGQVLQTGGAGANPSWIDASGGGLVYLATATGSNVSSISLDGYFTSDYTHYKVFYSTVPNTNNTDSVMRFRQSNADVTSSIHYYAGINTYITSSASNTENSGNWGTSRFQISSSDQTSNAAYPTTGEMVIYNALSTTQHKTFTTNNLGYNSGATSTAVRNHNFAGWFQNTNPISGFTFFYEGGNITGTLYLYGIKNS